jgi:hypothetical protein
MATPFDRVTQSLPRINYAAALAGHGITTVALNEAGKLVEHRPEGIAVVLAPKR